MKITLSELKYFIKKIIQESIDEENKENFELIRNMLDTNFSIGTQEQALSLAESLGFYDEVKEYIEEKFNEAKDYYRNKKHLFTNNMLQILIETGYFEPTISKLDLTGCENITDISPIIKLEKLTELNLSFCKQIENFYLLTALKNLKTLYLVGTKISIDELSQLENLLKRTEIVTYMYQ